MDYLRLLIVVTQAFPMLKHISVILQTARITENRIKNFNKFSHALQKKLLHAIIIIRERTEPKCLQPETKKC